ncbi:MAG: DUF1573 domain-containing protein, partial [Planctomycetaceae bacterium]|nr:DUF1573 domain-containing protein [Planctomycetaceae bacterium]
MSAISPRYTLLTGKVGFRFFCLTVAALMAVSGWSNYTWNNTGSNSVPEDTLSDDPFAPSSDASDTKGSQLEFSTNTVNFGTVIEGTKNVFPVTLTNRSPHPIDVVSASASCGCTSVLTETPFSIPPGENRDLQIQLNTRNNVGDLEKRVTVFVHEGDKRFKFPVSVLAHSTPLVDIDQREMDFGMIKSAETAERTVNISVNHQATAVAAESVYIATVPAGVRASLVESDDVIGDRRQWKLYVSISGRDVPEESLNEDLIIVTPSTVESVVRIPVRAKQHTLLRSTPDRVSFGVVRETSDVSRAIALTCPEEYPLEVLSVETPVGPEAVRTSYNEDSQ